ncbi:hypothetical protein QRX60_28475 [Amycolatopsis mongoliensis]|uniref:Antitoxin n=1 Tax=Amycolatopsis mongoliensis TaxID=715475 RepID=A0A9Y2JIJ0_9PSEU|nr:hypothetical protein [Amycolatopsis sp. 4-36]WIX98011.1 hypothetical protein QRX60_28475 [Amycolatopsis sp. 4-36]
MSLFDVFKDKAAELLGGASEKVSEVVGVDLPIGEAADQVAQSAAEVTETGQGVVDAVSAQGADVLDATGAVGDAIDPDARG